MISGQPIWDLARITDRAKSRMELTDLIRFKDHWYCGFREGEIHNNHPSGRGRVIRSADGERWDTAALFTWDGADVREPKLSITAEGLLMVNTSLAFVSRQPRGDGNGTAFHQLDQPGTPADDVESNVARQSVCWLSSDGVTWNSAYACPSGVNTWRWEVSWYNGMGYSIGYGGKDKAGTLYRTRDGKNWRALRSDLFPGGHGNEGSLAFGTDGTAYCLLRDACPRPALDADQTARASDGHEIRAGQGRTTHGTSLPMLGLGRAPYYQDWTWQPLAVDYGTGQGGARPSREVFRAPFGGPKLLRLRDGRLLAAGRMLGPGRDDGHITLFWLDPHAALLTYLDECDGATYGGIAEHEGHIWVTFGSRDVAAIRLGRLKLA